MEKNRNDRNFQHLLSLIKYPIYTEKGMYSLKYNTFVFIGDKSLTKCEIKKIFENITKGKIIKINTLILPKKKQTKNNLISIKLKSKTYLLGYQSNYKKIYIKFAEHKILLECMKQLNITEFFFN